MRELNNVVERAAWNAKRPEIRLEDLPSFLLTQVAPAPADHGPMALRDVVEDTEKALIRRVLKPTGNNKSRACKLLDVHRTTLCEKLAKYRIELSGD